MNKLFVDDDGYICFITDEDKIQKGVIWILHYKGWEAFFHDAVDPFFHTYDVTFPSEFDQKEVSSFVEEYLKEK